MTIPLNRLVAFAGPYISIAAGAITAWLLAKVNITGIPGLDQDNLTTGIAGGLTFALTAGLSWLGQQQWLKGHHIEMAANAQVTAAALTPAPAEVALPLTTGEVDDPEAANAAADVPDEEELAAPPPTLGTGGGEIHE